MIGHEDHRPAGFEQHAFVDHLLGHRFVAVGLADHDQIEAAGEAAEPVGGAGDAGIELRVSDETPARLAAASKRATAARAVFSDSARCDSMNSGGMPPITEPGMTGS